MYRRFHSLQNNGARHGNGAQWDNDVPAGRQRRRSEPPDLARALPDNTENDDGADILEQLAGNQGLEALEMVPGIAPVQLHGPVAYPPVPDYRAMIAALSNGDEHGTHRHGPDVNLATRLVSGLDEHGAFAATEGLSSKFSSHQNQYEAIRESKNILQTRIDNTRAELMPARALLASCSETYINAYNNFAREKSNGPVPGNVIGARVRELKTALKARQDADKAHSAEVRRINGDARCYPVTCHAMRSVPWPRYVDPTVPISPTDLKPNTFFPNSTMITVDHAAPMGVFRRGEGGTRMTEVRGINAQGNLVTETKSVFARASAEMPTGNQSEIVLQNRRPDLQRLVSQLSSDNANLHYTGWPL